MTADIFAILARPFDPSEIDWRVGPTNKEKTKGIALAYIDARAVMNRLDAATGGLWQCEYVPMPNGTCCCRIAIKIGDEWLWRSNGAITLTDSDKSDQKEMAEKGSYSDAFKRAAVLWGIGRYLYDTPTTWVEIKEFGRSYAIADHETSKLAAVLRGMTGGKPQSKPPNGTAPEPPQPTMAGRKNEAKGVSEAREWVNTAIARLKELTTVSLLDSFVEKNYETMDKIAKIVPEEHAALSKRLEDAYKKLNVLAAG